MNLPLILNLPEGAQLVQQDTAGATILLPGGVTEVHTLEPAGAGVRLGRTLVVNIPARAQDHATASFNILPVPPQAGSGFGAASPAPAGAGSPATGGQKLPNAD